MIVQSNALCSRLLRVSCRLSATRPGAFSSSPSPIPCIPCRHGRGYAIRIRSNPRKDSILQESGHAPACTCWSLLSPSSSVITSSVPTLKLRKAKIESGKTPLIVLLVTPAHIRLLDDGNTFIPSLLQLAMEKIKSWQHFDLLAVVVDRIPQKSSTASCRSRDGHAAHVGSSRTTRVEDGFQGISVAVLDSEAAVPDLWSPRDTSHKRETMTIQQRCTLSFSLPPSPGMRTQLSDKSASQPLVKRMLQLPVANTLFQNGRTSTLFAQKWEIKHREESTPEYVSSKKTWLPQQTIDMGSIFTDEGMRLHLDHSVHSHLTPVTPARTITAAVGNIVRKISGDDALAEAAPASEELERAISTAIQQGQIPAQQAGVWALIRPQRYAALDRAARLQYPVRDMIEYAILSGARLHKVLSGGGGWGEKHGLLALDPDSDYSYHHRAFEPSFGDDQDTEAEKREALGEVAKQGDNITFYVYRSRSGANPSSPYATVSGSSSQPATATLTFGSLPSTVDAMPEVDSTEAEAHAQSELMVEEDHFGMLSEQGMSLESSFLMTNVPASRMQYLRTELQRQAYEVRRSNTVTTKLDAPYTLLSIRGQASRIPVSSEIRGEELRFQNMDLYSLMPPEPLTAASTTKFTAALVQKLPKFDDQKQEAQPLVGHESLPTDRVLAKYQQRTEDGGSKLTRKEQRAKKLEASKIQSRIVKERNQRVAEEATVIIARRPEISEKVARKIARKEVKKAATEREKGNYRPQANNSAEQVNWKRSLGEKAFMMHHNRGETDDDPTSTVRFTSQEQEPYHKVTLQPEAQNTPSVTIRRHFSVNPGDFYQTHRASSEQITDVESEHESKPLSHDIKNEIEPDSIPISRVESEGKDPGIAYRGKEDSLFRLRKHVTMNAFERLQAIEKIGELTSRDQAMGLHSQYHLTLENQPGEVQKS